MYSSLKAVEVIFELLTFRTDSEQIFLLGKVRTTGLAGGLL